MITVHIELGAEDVDSSIAVGNEDALHGMMWTSARSRITRDPRPRFTTLAVEFRATR